MMQVVCSLEALIPSVLHIVGAALLVSTVGCGDADVNSLRHPYKAKWPVERVEAFGADSANCVACHDGGYPPPEAFDEEIVTAVSIRRSERTPESLLNTEIRFDRDNVTARKHTTESYYDVSVPSTEESVDATLAPSKWRAVSRAVARSGLFRFEGQADLDVSSSLGLVRVTVERQGIPDCTVFWLMGDGGRHTSFLALVAHLRQVEDSLDWQ